ncbi:MAG: hypothetical protein RIQ65_377, partial [Pseudomonadota bacterium]
DFFNCNSNSLCKIALMLSLVAESADEFQSKILESIEKFKYGLKDFNLAIFITNATY